MRRLKKEEAKKKQQKSGETAQAAEAAAASGAKLSQKEKQKAKRKRQRERKQNKRKRSGDEEQEEEEGEEEQQQQEQQQEEEDSEGDVAMDGDDQDVSRNVIRKRKLRAKARNKRQNVFSVADRTQRSVSSQLRTNGPLLQAAVEKLAKPVPKTGGDLYVAARKFAAKRQREKKRHKHAPLKNRGTEKADEFDLDQGAEGTTGPLRDLWGEPVAEAKELLKKDSFTIDALANMAKTRPRRKREQMEPHVIKAPLPVADAGTSFNPEATALADALQEAHKFAIKEKQRKEALQQLLRGEHKSQQVRPVVEYDWEAEEKNERDQGAAITVKPIVPENRVTKTQRNRRARHEAMMREHEKRRKEREHRKQLHNLKNIVADVDEEERKKKERLARRRARREEEERTGKRRPNLGNQVMGDEFPDIILTDEVTGSLRSTPTTLKAVKDQMRRIQAKNLIEPRRRHKLRRRYKKITYKRRKDKFELNALKED